MPRVAFGAAVPYPPAHCRTGGALSVLVCVAYPQPRQSWPSFGALGPRAPARRGEKGAPHFRLGTVRLLLHLVLQPLGQHRPCIKMHPVRSDTALCSSSPQAAFALSRRWCCASCRFGLPLWRFLFPPRHRGLLLWGPALRAMLLHPSQVMPYRHGARERRSYLDPHHRSRPQREEGPALGGDGRQQDRLFPQYCA